MRARQASKDRDLRQGIKDCRESYDNVEETAIQHDESQRVHEAMERLRDRQHDASAWAHFGGYTHLAVTELL